MSEQDVRWIQRFNNFGKAFKQLDEAVVLGRSRELSKLEKQGVIQAFENTYELAWNLLRDYLRWQGNAQLAGSRDTIREAFSAEQILAAIDEHYHAMFIALQQRMQTEVEKHGRS